MRDWIIGIVLAVIVLSIVGLYYFVYQINTKLDTQASTVERIVVNDVSQIDAQETEIVVEENDEESKTNSASCTQDCKSEIERLEALITKITPGTTRVIQSAPSTTAQSVKEITIALGSGEGESSDWVDVSGANAWIDSSNYKNIQSVTFEGSLHVPTENGWVTARLYNKSEEHPVWSSEITAEESTPQLRYSDQITLGNGNNLYQVQIKNTLGTRSLIESARVKILLK